MKYQILSILVLLSVSTQVFAQGRFLVNIVMGLNQNDSNPSFRCIGTIFTSKHVMVPASCVTSNSAAVFSIQVPTGAETGVGDPLMITLPVERIHINTDFEQNARINNIAIVEAVDEFNATDFAPRRLGELQSNSSCVLFGWSDNHQNNPRGDAVVVHGPNFCDPTFDQVFCTTFPFSNDTTCEAELGGPLICGDNHSIFAGFHIGSDRTCTIRDNRPRLEYHSISQYRRWVDEVSAADITKTPVFLILSAIIVSIKNLM